MTPASTPRPRALRSRHVARATMAIARRADAQDSTSARPGRQARRNLVLARSALPARGGRQGIERRPSRSRGAGRTAARSLRFLKAHLVGFRVPALCALRTYARSRHHHRPRGAAHLRGPVLGSAAQPANYEAQRGHRPGRGGAITPVGRGSSNGSAGRRSWKCRVGGWCQQLCIARGQCRSCRPATGPVRAAGVPPPCEPGTSAGARSPNPAATLRAGARTQAEGRLP